jgi:uncharacterized protein YceH (UPF0502 family)
MTEALRLNGHEARVLGVLVEKELTTPDQYPLSLNALVNGCNQKSNRDPVVDFLEPEVVVALQGLTMKGLAGRVSGAGSRVEKFRHNARERLKVDAAGAAILAELLMRGPQAPGELRARVNRMSPIPGQDELRAALERLEQAGLVARVRGARAERFAQQLAPGLHPEGGPSTASDSPASAAAGAPTSTTAAAPSATPASGGLAGRVEALEAEVAELRARLERLASDLGAEA